MDPNMTLHELREAVARAQNEPNMEDDAQKLARLENLVDDFMQHFDSLDGWMTKGGALPDAWRETRDHR